MNVLITGGGGFIGSRLAAALLQRDPKARITLLDMGFPNGTDSRFECVEGDVASPVVIWPEVVHPAITVDGPTRERTSSSMAGTW